MVQVGHQDLRPLPLIDRRLKLTKLAARSSVHCLHLVQGFDNGAKLLEQPSCWAGGLRFEAPSVSLHLGTIPRLGQDQDRRVASCEPERWKAFKSF
jgi:hypothetical protein